MQAHLCRAARGAAAATLTRAQVRPHRASPVAAPPGGCACMQDCSGRTRSCSAAGAPLMPTAASCSCISRWPRKAASRSSCKPASCRWQMGMARSRHGKSAKHGMKEHRAGRQCITRRRGLGGCGRAAPHQGVPGHLLVARQDTADALRICRGGAYVLNVGCSEGRGEVWRPPGWAAAAGGAPAASAAAAAAAPAHLPRQPPRSLASARVPAPRSAGARAPPCPGAAGCRPRAPPSPACAAPKALPPACASPPPRPQARPQAAAARGAWAAARPRLAPPGDAVPFAG